MNNEKLQDGYCVYARMLFQGPVPVVSSDDKYIIFETELEAHHEIAEHAIQRVGQFLKGERDFEDAMKIEEYVVLVSVHSDGSFTDEDGNCFGPDVG